MREQAMNHARGSSVPRGIVWGAGWRAGFVAWLCALSLGMAASGCGNYSNEDLEFMNAVPMKEDLTVDVPRQSSLTTVASAEGWQRTFKVTRDLNAVATTFLSLVDRIRRTYPNAREANTRIWGPYPSDDNPGWQIEFRMTKDETVEPQYNYELVMIPPPGVVLLNGGPSTQIIGGSFAATAGVRLGKGRLVVSLDEARAAGVVFSGLDKLSTLTIDYDTRAWPRGVTMVFVNAPPVSADEAASATYTYHGAQNGDGDMTFSWVQDVVPGPVGADTLLIESRWLGTGPGREDLSIVAGDGVGATETECWNQSFRSTFLSQSWQTSSVTGDKSLCPL